MLDVRQAPTATPIRELVEDAHAAPATTVDDRKFRPDIEGLRAVAMLPSSSPTPASSPRRLRRRRRVLRHLRLPHHPPLLARARPRRQHLAARASAPAARGASCRRRRSCSSAIVVVVGCCCSPLRIRGGPSATSSRRALRRQLALRRQATDYFAAAPPSPVQHFWSLAVEEQFYVVWPLLLAVAWFWRRRGAPCGRRCGRGLAARHGGSLRAVGRSSTRRSPVVRLLLDRPRGPGSSALGGAAGARRSGIERLPALLPRAAWLGLGGDRAARRSPSTRDAVPRQRRAAAGVRRRAVIAARLAARRGARPRLLLGCGRSSSSAASPTPGTSGTGRR